METRKRRAIPKDKRPAGSEWIAGWIDECGDKIAQFALALTKDSETAQDIAQETFLRLEQWHAAHPDRSVHVGWLYTTAHHLIVDHSRRHRPEVSWEDYRGTMPHLSGFEADVATRLSVQDILDALPAADRECLFLFYYQDWSIAQIAHHLGVAEPAVRGRLFRARARFAQHWGGE